MQENINSKIQSPFTRRKVFSYFGKGVAALGLLTIPGFALFSQKSKKLSVKIHPDAIQRKNGRER